jgi:3-phenylpropionate/trans-cinnamate dioxygenase ferredoxin reductase component
VAGRSVDYLLIGGGIAAANCARWLRESGADGSILLVGREPDPPYNRPPCSKGYLQGSESREETWFRPAGWWEEQDVELLTRTSVMKLEPGDRTARLSTKDEVRFDKALLATGATVRRLNLEGSDLEGIHYLRTLGNSDAICDGTTEGDRVVLIGGSYIATEVAASLTLRGRRCALVMQESITLERGFGATAGRFFQERLEEHGVEVHGGEDLECIAGSDGRVREVVCDSGLRLEADAVVMGVGAVPDVMLARAAGLKLGGSGGVACSARLETSVPGVFAAGDMCEYDSVIHAERLRIEHWDVAFNHGRTAALNMLGRDQPHDVVPYFFSDLADWSSLEYVGPAREWDEEVVRGSPDEGAFSVWYLAGGRVAGCLAVGRSEDLSHAGRLLAERVEMTGRRAHLLDVDSDLAELGAAERPR